MTDDLLRRGKAGILVQRWRSDAQQHQAEGSLTGNRPLPARLSFAQEGLWIAEHLRRKGQNIICFAGVIDAAVDLDVLASAVEHIGQRHPVLTAGVQEVSGVPRQVPTRQPRLRLAIAEGQSYEQTEAASDAELGLLAQRIAAEPFDLTHGPLARVTAVRLASSRYLLIMAAHHLAADGWSMAILLGELTDYYNSPASGTGFRDARPAHGPSSPSNAVTYGDFAARQRADAESGLYQADIEYWRHRLSDLDTVQLPPDHVKVPDAAASPWQEVVLSTELSQGACAFARREGTTVFTVILASLQLALQRWTGHQDIVVGCSAANRRAGMHNMVGLAANLLLMRADFTDDPPFRVLTDRVRRSVAGALTHTGIPFEHLVRSLDLPGAGSEPFPLGLTWESWPMPTLSLGGSGLRRLDFGICGPNRPVELYLRQQDDVIRGRVDFDPDRFSPAVITRLISCWRRLLHGALAEPDRPGSTLPFTSPAEVLQQANWFRTSVRPPEDTVAERFAFWAKTTPGALAVDAGSRTLTYGQLGRLTDGLAGHLRELGVRTGTLVATLLPRSPEFVGAVLSVIKAGGAYVPLDPAVPDDYLARRLAAANTPVLLTTQDRSQSIEAHMPDIKIVCVDGICSSDGDRADAPFSGRPAGSDLAYVIFTSGSTGEPKPVMITHQSLANLCTWHQRAYRISQHDRASQIASPAFDAAGWEIWPYLSAGASIHIVPDKVRADPAALVSWLAAARVTICFLPTPLAELVLGETGLQELSLRALLTGGDRLACRRPPGSSFELANNYGPTEATVVATWEVVPDASEELGLPAIGRPIDNCLVRVLDANQRPVPIGAPGELYIGGAGLARGYLGEPALTAQHFVYDQDGTRLYRTGDRVRPREDGRLEFLGRTDRQIKVRGIRIEPAEIEAVLGRHPSVAQTVIGELDGRLISWVVPSSSAAVTESELRNWLSQRCPSYMLPAQWVVMPEFPVTVNGKRDHSALTAAARRSAAAAHPGTVKLGMAEAALAETWSSALSLSGIGPEDDFFALGGDSLAAMRIVSLARRRGFMLDPEDIFRERTVRNLAAVAGTRPAPQLKTADPHAGVAASAAVPLMPCQRELFARGWMSPHRWDQSVLCEVNEILDPGLLADAAALLIDRHDALRLRFRRTGDGWQQHVQPPGARHGNVVDTLDLLGQSPQERAQSLHSRAVALQDARDLTNGPLVSLVSVDGGGGHPDYLLTSIHHLAVDALSTWIFLNELLNAYRQLRDGQPVRLPEPTTPYANWARQAAEIAQTSRVRGEEEYWREQCRPGAALPYDHNTGPLQIGSNANRSITLDVPTTRRLVATGMPVRDVLLTAVAMTLAQPGTDSFVVDVRDHGRRLFDQEVDLSWTMGWFMTVYPVRLRLEAASPSEQFAAIKNQVAAVPNHGLGYSLLRYVTDGGVQNLTSSAAVSVNYVGNLGGGLPTGLRPVLDQIIVNPDGRVASRCPIQITSGIIAGRFRTECFFSLNRFGQSTIDRLTGRIEEALHTLIGTM